MLPDSDFLGSRELRRLGLPRELWGLLAWELRLLLHLHHGRGTLPGELGRLLAWEHRPRFLKSCLHEQGGRLFGKLSRRRDPPVPRQLS